MGWNESDAEFELWCFGPGYKDLVASKGYIALMHLWNQRHSDLLVLNPSDVMGESHDRMMKLWEESKTGESRDYP